MKEKRRRCVVCMKLTEKWHRYNGGPWHCYDGCYSTTGRDNRSPDAFFQIGFPEDAIDAEHIKRSRRIHVAALLNPPEVQMNLMKFELDFSQQPSGLRVHIKDTTDLPENIKHLQFRHQFTNWKNDAERRIALSVFFDGVARILRQRMFPKDTLIYDTVETPDGDVKLSNPRYPDAK